MNIEKGVLSDITIERYITEHNLIYPHDKNNIKGASYDLTMGKEYYIWEKRHKGNVKIEKLRKKETFIIPPNGVCYIICNETINLPKNICGSLSLKLGLIAKGVMLASQPPIDPGYEGKIIAMLYNLSSRVIPLCEGDHILTLELSFLDQEANQKYSGDRKIEKLEQVIKQPIRGSLRDLELKIDNWRNSIQRYIPLILFVITAIIGCITILFTVLTVKNILIQPTINYPIEQTEQKPSKETNKGSSDINSIKTEKTN